jgi:hypothetical protein
MRPPKIIYKGNVQVYLQGQKALLPISLPVNQDEINYYIGAESAHLIINDHRKVSNSAAQQVLSGEQGIKFSQHFNQPALIEISKEKNKVTIDLREAENENNPTVLWIGVIHNGTMPVHRITWQVLKPIDQSSVAFAAIVED